MLTLKTFINTLFDITYAIYKVHSKILLINVSPALVLILVAQSPPCAGFPTRWRYKDPKLVYRPAHIDWIK